MRRLSIKKALVFISVSAAIAVTTVSLLSFCILTNNSGDYRMYFQNISGTQYIPLVYRLHNSTPNSYFTPVWNGANTWNNVQSAYWLFEEGETTSNNHLAQNGINLVYFDFAGDNFDPGTSTIAFSMTYISYQGGVFHAVESDLIWNARDYPPSPYDYPTNQYDLQSVITHEFGHHFGLGHQGSPGSPPGCGELIEAATMYGYASYYDTTKRSLHPHDKAGISTIYPTWVIAGSVTDSASGNPVGGAYIILNQGKVTTVGPPEYNNTWECPGYIISDTLWVDSNGLFAEVALDQDLSLLCKSFGYESRSAEAHFGPPGGIEETDTIFIDFVLPQEPGVTVSGTVQDETTSAGIAAEVAFYGLTNPGSFPIAVASTDSQGNFSVSIPAGPYRLEVHSEPPYPPHYETINIGDNGADLTILLSPAQLLLYDDDNGENRENVYIGILDSLGITYHHWDMNEQTGPIEFSVVRQFQYPLTVVWFTAMAQNPLSNEEVVLIDSVLSYGGRIFLNGNNIASSLSDDSFLGDRLHAVFVSKVSNQLLKSVAGDPIGQDKYMSVGTLSADKDMIRTDGHPQAAPVFQVLGQSDFGMIRYEGDYHLVLGGFVFSDITETQDVFITRYELLQNILGWFDDENHLPEQVSLHYPEHGVTINWDEEPDTVRFSWFPAADQDGDELTYHLFISTDSSFNIPYLFTGSTVDTSFSYVLDLSCDEWDNLTQDSTLTLYWSVYCSDGKGVSLAGEIRRIDMADSWENLPPEPVTLLSPADGDTLYASVLDSAVNVLFSWSRSDDPNCNDTLLYGFKIRFSLPWFDDDTIEVIYEETLTDTTLVLNLRDLNPVKDDTTLFYTTYHWDVYAFDGELTSDTMKAAFTLEEIYIDENDPPVLSGLFQPGEGDSIEVMADTILTLSWFRATDPDSSDSLFYLISVFQDSHLIVDATLSDTLLNLSTSLFLLTDSMFRRIDWQLYCSDGRLSSDTVMTYFYLFKKPVSIHEEQTVPESFTIYPAYPNPFNPSATVSFAIPEAGLTRVLIFNLKGQVIRTLLNGSMSPGSYSIVWDGRDDKGRDVSSGIYLLSVRWKDKAKHYRLLLIK